MGKKFYGESPNKADAKHAANYKAITYRRARCFTLASDSTCDLLENGNWRCMAKAHHTRGACDKSSTFRIQIAELEELNSDDSDEEYTDATIEDLSEIERAIDSE